MEYKFKWTSDISVNNEIIDNQHKQLLNQVNLLLDSFINNKDKNIVESSISFLNDYINEHFKYEEEYMRSINYPNIEKHISLHKDFIDHYKQFKEKINNNVSKDILILEIENYIGNWWIEHIGHADKEYANYLKNIPN